MALLQVRNGVSTLLTLGVWLLSAIICTGPLSVDAFFGSSPDKTPGPDPRIRIITHPLDHVIILSNSTVDLNCVANYTADQYIDDEYMEDDYMPYIGDEIESIPDVQSDEPIATNQTDETEFHSDVLYEWFRDGKLVDRANSSIYKTFCNGTIRIAHSRMASGTYRCRARTKHPEIGAVLSKASHVDAAIFERKPNHKMDTKAEHSSSVVINCPIESVPAVNVTWSFKNSSNIDFAAADRFFQLNNGSLLIVNVKNQDGQMYQCSMRNPYFKNAKSVRHKLEIIPAKSSTRSALLPPLQDEKLFIPSGKPLRLHCATIDDSVIGWTFAPRASTSATKPIAVQKQNELKIETTSVQQHDGIYKCWSGAEYQSFDVAITTPPVIQTSFTSKEESLGYYVSFACNVSGNPKPTIEWYRDGKLINYDWIVSYKEPKLLIQTFEEEHKGIYRCVARNPAGEVHATGLLSLKQKTYTDPPRNVKCFPISLDSYKVTFDGPQNFKWSAITYYTASKHEPYWQSSILHDPNQRIQDEFTVANTNRLPFEPFMLYFRGMENTGSDIKHKGGVRSYQFEISRLSKGVNCALQGLSVFGMFSQNGIFIWWPKVDHVNVRSYLIQFKSNDPTNFSDHVIGTTIPIDEFLTWKDIDGHLTKVPVVTNVHELSEEDTDDWSSENDSNHSKLITELRISGNVTGILIPNTMQINVRILVPVVDEDGELIQDTRFVEWKKIRDVPGRRNKFQVSGVGTQRVTFFSTDPQVDCVRICYRSNEDICEDKSIQNSYVEVDSLVAFTAYKFILSECSQTKTFYNEYNIQTEPDIPGAVTNHRVYKKDGIVMEWSAPISANGRLKYYLVEWNIANETHSERIPYRNDTDKNVFKFPDVQENDRFKITIRAVSNFGTGNPIYINLFDFIDIPDENQSSISARKDRRLGIAIGALLSFLYIFVCMLIIVRHRRCMKRAQRHQMNGGAGRNSSINRSGNDRSTNGTTVFTSSSTQITANCTLDGHEMQTLILASDQITTTNGNGIAKRYEHHSNGEIVQRSTDRSSYCAPVADSEEEDHVQDMSRHGLISSTPKAMHKAIICRNAPADAEPSDNNRNTITRISVYSVHEELEMLQPNDLHSYSHHNSLKSLTKSKLPQHNSSHSIDHNTNESPPMIKRVIDDKFIKSTTNPAAFDDSQQNLLRKASMNGSSASTSSGLNVDTSSNSTSAPHDHRSSQLYLFNENDINHDDQIIEMDANDESSVLFELHAKTKVSAPPLDEISIDLNEDDHYQKRLPPKWDYRRPIVGPNG